MRSVGLMSQDPTVTVPGGDDRHTCIKTTHIQRNDERVHKQNWWTEEKLNEAVRLCNASAPSPQSSAHVAAGASATFKKKKERKKKSIDLNPPSQPPTLILCRLQANMLACFHLVNAALAAVKGLLENLRGPLLQFVSSARRKLQRPSCCCQSPSAAWNKRIRCTLWVQPSSGSYIFK